MRGVSECDRGTYTMPVDVESPRWVLFPAGPFFLQKFNQPPCTLSSEWVDCDPSDWEDDGVCLNDSMFSSVVASTQNYSIT